MGIIKSDILSFIDGYVVIPTNGMTYPNGELIMGAGLALAARNKFFHLPRMAGDAVRKSGNNVYIFDKYKVITFPTKNEWFKPADIKLIRKSFEQLADLIVKHDIEKVYMPKVGCGNGGLDWERDVFPIFKLFSVFEKKVVLVDKN